MLNHKNRLKKKMLRKIIIIGLLLLFCPIISQAQGVKYAVFGNAADTSNACIIGNGDLFTGLEIPDDIDSDSLRFLVSRDGTNYYNLLAPTSQYISGIDSASVYYVIIDTTNACIVSLNKNVFRNIRRLKIITDDATSASSDTIEVIYADDKRFGIF